MSKPQKGLKALFWVMSASSYALGLFFMLMAGNESFNSLSRLAEGKEVNLGFLIFEVGLCALTAMLLFTWPVMFMVKGK